jgi:two-component system NtrC family sensor kinase
LVLVKINLERGKINVIRQLDAGLPAVLADRNKIEQVFVNILLNAIQAMPDGGDIVVRGYVKQLSEVKNGIGRRQNDSFKLGEKVVMVEFEDTGIGISEENLTKVFDPFFTTKGPSGGTGLGLSVTKNILNMHKGLISVTSKVGKGTKVTLTLKIA